MPQSAPHTTGIPAHLLAQHVRLFVDDGEADGIVMTAEEFFLPQDPDVIEIDEIVATLLASGTYRAGGGAEVEWTLRMAEPVQWVEGDGWVRDRAAACREDIAHGLHGTLTEARAAFGYATPGDVDGIVDTIRRQIASCLPGDADDIDRRVDLLVANIDGWNLRNEADRIAGWVPPDRLEAAARFAVRDLRGRF